MEKSVIHFYCSADTLNQEFWLSGECVTFLQDSSVRHSSVFTKFATVSMKVWTSFWCQNYRILCVKGENNVNAYVIPHA